jgi:hypothetical protein
MAVRIVLVKFGEQSNISKLREEGLLYMNNLPYFWGTEDEELRGDPNDGVEHIQRGVKGKAITLDGEELEITKWEMRVPPREPEKINIFCAYAIRTAAGTFLVDERNYRFGSHALVLLDTGQFIHRIASSLDSQAIPYEMRLVRYLDDQYVGRLGPFKKLRRFAYQSEFRLVCYEGPGGPREVRVGSIEDISIMMPSEEVNRRIRIAAEGAIEAP